MYLANMRVWQDDDEALAQQKEKKKEIQEKSMGTLTLTYPLNINLFCKFYCQLKGNKVSAQSTQFLIFSLSKFWGISQRPPVYTKFTRSVVFFLIAFCHHFGWLLS